MLSRVSSLLAVPASWMACGLLLACHGACPLGSYKAEDGLCTLPPPEAAAAVGLSEDAAEVAISMHLTEVPDSPSNAFADDPDAAALGHWLFYDAGLSRSGRFRCGNCHDPHQDFHDGKRISDDGESLVHRNTPSAGNGIMNQWQYWGGRCDTLWCQAANPIENDLEMNSTRLEVAHHIHDTPDLAAAYESLFGPLPDLDDPRFPETGRPDPVFPDSEDALNWDTLSEADQLEVSRVLANTAKALAAFERTLIRMDAPFDTFVEGLQTGNTEQLAALTDSQVRGLELFVGEAGCVQCHSGPRFTNDTHVNTGLGPRPWLLTEDRGRYDGLAELQAEDFAAVGPFSDDPAWGQDLHDAEGPITDNLDGAYRVTSLRNVALSAPYMHGGHFESLDEVVEFYVFLDEAPLTGRRDERLVPLDLSARDAADLVAFLESLTGTPLDPSKLEPPEAPWAD